MQLSETVTFGGSGMDRRADLRGDSQALAALAVSDGADHIALWRGKPFIDLEAQPRLVRLATGSVVLEHAGPEPFFLGMDGKRPVFAHDISAWEPPDGAPETLGAFHDPSQQNFPSAPQTHAFCELRSVMADLSARDAELVASAKALMGWHISHRYCSACGAPSLVTQAGWQRDCPSCNTSHFPRTDPVVIMLILHGNSALLGRSPGWPDGMYSLLAGFVEPGETIEAAVRREVLEEAGIRVGQVDYLAAQPWPFPASLMMGCRGTALDTKITIDPSEIDDAIWVSREEMLSVMAGEHDVMRAPRRGSIAQFILENWLADRR